MSATDTCDGPQTVANQDFNNYDCTSGGTAPGYNKGSACWEKGQAPSAGVQRLKYCFSVGSDGKTLTKVDDALCAAGDSSYDVHILDMAGEPVTLPTVACSSTTAGTTPCKFDDTAANLDVVNATGTCAECTTCPTYVIGVTPFAPSNM
jgi:hypothetical protein